MRTLEQAIEREFDRDRREHGWAREGKDMGRDDFIDLAFVSKQVPGKTPTQVSTLFTLKAKNTQLDRGLVRFFCASTLF